MNYIEAEKLARKIKRCLDSIPEDVRVIITSSSISVCDREELYDYEDKHGHLDNPPALAHQIFYGHRVIGFDSNL